MTSNTPPMPTISHAGYAIITPRLVIRTALLTDGEALLTYLTNPNHYGAETDLTLEALLPRIDKWAAKTHAGESAFMLIFLRATGKVIGFGGFNSLPRTRVLSSGERTSDDSPEEEKVKAGDVGVGLAPGHRRKGYAREAVCAMAEFGFDTLGCGYIHMDTMADNEGFRGVMRDMGIPEKAGSGVEHEDALFKFAWKSLNYDFDKPMWERVRDDLKTKEKWPL